MRHPDTDETSGTKMTLGDLLQRIDISWKAKGLAAAICIHQREFQSPGPDKIQLLVTAGMESETSIQSGLRELETKGILIRTLHRSETGRAHVIGSSWEINIEHPN